jgi:CHAD domain-containing protein
VAVNETDSMPCGASQVPTDLLKRRFAGQAAEFASAASRVRGGQDPEAVHDLRVSARNMDAMLRTWAGLVESRARAAALRSLRRLRRRLGSARELEAHIALLEPTAVERGEPVLSLVEALRGKLLKRTACAARRLRPRRLRSLMERIEAANASLGSRPAGHRRAFDRARTYVLERRAVARIAVELALAREDDWLLHQARLAIKKWRYALECVNGAWTDPGPDPRPALRQLQEILGGIQDRAALIAAVERHRRKGDRPGFEGLLGQLRAEKQDAFSRFRALAAAHGAPRPVVARLPRVTPGPVHEPAAPAAGSTDERWERMAQWLLGKGPER